MSEAVNFFGCVVVDEGGADDSDFGVDTEAAEQARRVHVAIADSDAVFRALGGNFRGGHFGQVEADGGDAMADFARISDAVDCGAIELRQATDEFAGERGLIGANGVQSAEEIGTAR